GGGGAGHPSARLVPGTSCAARADDRGDGPRARARADAGGALPGADRLARRGGGMRAVLALFALRLRLLRNRLRVRRRAGRVGRGFLRGGACRMAFAFLRFGGLLMAETARDAGRRFGASTEEFFFSASLLLASAIIFVVNLLVFAAEEFDTTDSTRDTAF